jgi:hypothetical protein
MSRIEINAGGRAIAVDAEGPVGDLAREALQLWRHTEGPTPQAATEGAAFGFHTELGPRPEYASAHQIDMGERR